MVCSPRTSDGAAVVAYGATPAIEGGAVAEGAAGTEPPADADTASRPPGRGWTWAQLMRRAFALDVLACPACGGRLRLIGLIFDPPPGSRHPRLHGRACHACRPRPTYRCDNRFGSGSVGLIVRSCRQDRLAVRPSRCPSVRSQPPRFRGS